MIYDVLLAAPSIIGFGPLQVEGGFFLLGERRPFALETGSNPVKIEVVTAVIECGCFTVDIAPIGTDLSFLIESRAIGAKESEVLHTNSGHFDAHVEHLALGFRVGVITAEDFVATCEAGFGHIVQTVAWSGQKLAIVADNCRR